MKEFVNQLFLQSNFEHFQAEQYNGQLFFNNCPDGKISYWIVLEKETPDLIAEQSAIFNQFKTLVRQQDFDKNCSLLLLIRRSGAIDDQLFKKKTLLIEDNPYYFKKYVLGYTTKEFEELTIARNNRTELPFLEREMVSRACFDVYKKNPYAKNWQSLIFRLALKIPFVNVNVEVKHGLSALFEDNQTQLVSKGLNTLNDAVKSFCIDKTTEEINALTPRQFLDALNLNNLQNVNQNSPDQDKQF